MGSQRCPGARTNKLGTNTDRHNPVDTRDPLLSVSEPNRNRNYVPYPDDRGLSELFEDEENGTGSHFLGLLYFDKKFHLNSHKYDENGKLHNIQIK